MASVMIEGSNEPRGLLSSFARPVITGLLVGPKSKGTSEEPHGYGSSADQLSEMRLSSEVEIRTRHRFSRFERYWNISGGPHSIEARQIFRKGSEADVGPLEGPVPWARDRK